MRGTLSKIPTLLPVSCHNLYGYPCGALDLRPGPKRKADRQHQQPDIARPQCPSQTENGPPLPDYRRNRSHCESAVSQLTIA